MAVFLTVSPVKASQMIALLDGQMHLFWGERETWMLERLNALPTHTGMVHPLIPLFCFWAFGFGLRLQSASESERGKGTSILILFPSFFFFFFTEKRVNKDQEKGKVFMSLSVSFLDKTLAIPFVWICGH
jgi:hypothetical protein